MVEQRTGNKQTQNGTNPILTYRVEGISRRGVIRFVKIVGQPGAWAITGLNGLRVQVAGRTVEDAIRLAKRRIPFRPVAIRLVSEDPAPSRSIVQQVSSPGKNGQN